MKFMQKKYPLLIATIVSCVIIVASLFILGFFGLRLSVGLGGGSSVEINMVNKDLTSADYTKKVNEVLHNNGLSIDTSFVEDKYVVGEDSKGYVRKCFVAHINKKGITEQESAKIKAELAEKLGIDISYVSNVEEITSSVRAKDVLFVALAVGIIALCFFVFAWIRYDIFAGLSFILAFLHNIILYLSILILTRIQLTVISLSAVLILTLVMSVILVHIYEKFREASKMQNADKIPASERMLTSEKQVIKPYLIIAATALGISLLLLIIPSAMVRLSSLSVLIALIVTAYTSLIIGPASYTALLDIRDMNRKAILSRNDTVNKAIKKKIKKSNKKAKAGK